MSGDYRTRFEQIQAQFIEQPQTAVRSAKSLVEEAVSRLMEDLRRDDVGDKADTEQLRLAMMRYRDVLSQVTGEAAAPSGASGATSPPRLEEPSGASGATSPPRGEETSSPTPPRG